MVSNAGMRDTMSIFKDADELYRVMQELFEQLEAKQPAAFGGLYKQRMTVRFRCTAPTGEITIEAKVKPTRMTYGPFNGRPDIDLDLSADNLHRLLMHELSTKKAVTDGTIKFKGNPFKLTPLLELIKAGRELYPQIAQRHNLKG